MKKTRKPSNCLSARIIRNHAHEIPSMTLKEMSEKFGCCVALASRIRSRLGIKDPRDVKRERMRRSVEENIGQLGKISDKAFSELCGISYAWAIRERRMRHIPPFERRRKVVTVFRLTDEKKIAEALKDMAEMNGSDVARKYGVSRQAVDQMRKSRKIESPKRKQGIEFRKRIRQMMKRKLSGKEMASKLGITMQMFRSVVNTPNFVDIWKEYPYKTDVMRANLNDGGAAMTMTLGCRDRIRRKAKELRCSAPALLHCLIEKHLDELTFDDVREIISRRRNGTQAW